MISTNLTTRPSGLMTICALSLGGLVAAGLAALAQYSGPFQYWPVALALTVLAFVPLVYGFATLRQWLMLAP
jgi:lysozyme family protein